MANMLPQLIVLSLAWTGLEGNPVIREVSQPALVSILRGKPATLNCTFNYIANDSNWIYVSWYKTSHGMTERYNSENNLTCIPDIAPGIFHHCAATLKIENVSFRMSDSNYTCVVKVPTIYPPIEEKGPGTQLHVVVPPSPPAISVTQETLVAEKVSSLYCLAGGFYPQSISIKWLQAILDNSQSSPADAETRYRTQEFTFSNMDGTFNTTSQLTFVPTSQDHGLIYTCQVHHSTSEKQIIKQIRLKVNYGPKLVIYYRTSDTDMFHRLDQEHIHVKHQTFLELNCTADSNPVATVIWKKISQEQSLQLAAGVNISILKIASIEYSDSGAYLCGAQNDYGFQEFPVNIYLKSDLGSSFPVRSVTFLVFLVSVISLLIWGSEWKDRYCPCNSRNSKQCENQGKSCKVDPVEDADVHEEITSKL